MILAVDLFSHAILLIATGSTLRDVVTCLSLYGWNLFYQQRVSNYEFRVTLNSFLFVATLKACTAGHVCLRTKDFKLVLGYPEMAELSMMFSFHYQRSSIG